jgi:hypothetical protein
MRKYERAATRRNCQNPPPPPPFTRQGPARQIVMTAKYFRPHCIVRDCYLYATSRKVAGSIPDGALELIIDVILPAALWPWVSTHLLTEMSTRNISWGVKTAGA